MAYFKDAQEVYSTIGKIFELAVEDPVLSRQGAKAGVVLRLNYRDPDTTILVDFPKRQVKFGDEAAEGTANVQLFTEVDVAHRFWLGKENITVALARGRIKAKGPVPKVLKLVPLAKSLFPKYEELLIETGRRDLLDVP
jgi:hypothetical protein